MNSPEKEKREQETYESFFAESDQVKSLRPSWKPSEEQDELIVTAVAFLDALSRTPYNNKPITDAQVIVKQLLVFLDNPKLYDPDTIPKQQQQEVDLEKEIEEYWIATEWSKVITLGKFKVIARYFYGLGQLNSK